LYTRDLYISKELSEYCKNNNGVNIVNSIGNNTIQLPASSGESRELWNVLFSNPDTELLIDINNKRLVEKTGLYVFKAMPANSPECIRYDHYIDQQPKRMKAYISRDFAAYSDSCIGIYKASEFEKALNIEYKTQYIVVSSNASYSFMEETNSLIDESTGQELAYLKRPLIKRAFKLFEFSTLFHFNNSCPKPIYQPEYQLLSGLLSHQRKTL